MINKILTILEVAVEVDLVVVADQEVDHAATVEVVQEVAADQDHVQEVKVDQEVVVALDQVDQDLVVAHVVRKIHAHVLVQNQGQDRDRNHLKNQLLVQNVVDHALDLHRVRRNEQF